MFCKDPSQLSRIFSAIVLRMLFLALGASLYSQEASDTFVEIRSIQYTIDGASQEYAVRMIISELREGAQFPDRATFEVLANDSRRSLENTRTIQVVTLDYSYETRGDTEFVDIEIYIKDTKNIVVLPYVKWDDNDGLTLSTRLRDYNFIGTHSAASFDADYRYSDSKGHGFRTAFSSQPVFPLGVDNRVRGIFSLELLYSEVDNVSINNTLGFGLPFLFFTQFWELRMLQETSASQLSPGQTNNTFFGKTTLELGGPISTQLRLPMLGMLYYDMLMHTDFKYNYIGSNANSVHSSELFYRHGIRASRYQWVGNFRKGIGFTLRHKLALLPLLGETSRVRNEVFFEGKFFYPFFNRIAVKTRGTFIATFNHDVSSPGAYYRGIRNYFISGRNMHASLNTDISLRLFAIPSLLEAHGSLFVDMGISMQRELAFEPERDFFLTTGIEGIAYFYRFRSLVLRASLGIDPFLLQETLKHTQGFNAFWDSKELFIGFGLYF